MGTSLEFAFRSEAHAMSKYDAFRRSQVLHALHHAETKLLLMKANDPRRPAVVREREQLFAALHIKDAEIFRAWEDIHLFRAGKRKI
jgi:hypothetical protein